jgi:thymidine kinase
LQLASASFNATYPRHDRNGFTSAGDPSTAKLMAKLTFCYGAMNAGKSTLLLQASHNYQEHGMRTMLFTSALYAEAGVGRIASRLGIEADAFVFSSGEDLFQQIEAANAAQPLDCVLIDEAQFLTPGQVWQLARVADHLDLPVICYGLRTDFQGKLFQGSQQLLAIADELREIRTVCRCGEAATMTARIDRAGRAVLEGAQVKTDKSDYVSLCRRHWEEALARSAEAQA